MAIKIFDQLYVGLRTQGKDKPFLGFATPLENNAAFKKRKDTVDNWASSYLHYWDSESKTQKRSKPVESMTLDNKPRAGFKITDDVKRVYWGGGNVVWRVLDPEGFELEIASSNLMALIQTVGIQAGGLINGKCAYARDGSVNVLLHEGCDEYKNAFNVDKAVKITPTDLRVGDMVLIPASKSPAQFLGRYYMGEYMRYPDQGKSPMKVSQYYFFKLPGGTQETTVWYAKPKILARTGVSVVDNPEKIINKFLRKGYHSSVYSNVSKDPTTFVLGLKPIAQESVAKLIVPSENKMYHQDVRDRAWYDNRSKTEADMTIALTYFNYYSFRNGDVEGTVLGIAPDGTWYRLEELQLIINRLGYLDPLYCGGHRNTSHISKMEFNADHTDVKFVEVDARKIAMKTAGITRQEFDAWLQTLQIGILTVDKK